MISFIDRNVIKRLNKLMEINNWFIQKWPKIPDTTEEWPTIFFIMSLLLGELSILCLWGAFRSFCFKDQTFAYEFFDERRLYIHHEQNHEAWVQREYSLKYTRKTHNWLKEGF